MWQEWIEKSLKIKYQRTRTIFCSSVHPSFHHMWRFRFCFFKWIQLSFPYLQQLTLRGMLALATSQAEKEKKFQIQ